MNAQPDSTIFPLLFKIIQRQRRMSAFSIAATAPLTDEQLPLQDAGLLHLLVRALHEHKSIRYPFGQRFLCALWVGVRHQYSIPFWALTPLLYGCLTSFISVTRSASSINSSFALRP